jgi:hypothetical protein
MTVTTAIPVLNAKARAKTMANFFMMVLPSLVKILARTY